MGIVSPGKRRGKKTENGPRYVFGEVVRVLLADIRPARINDVVYGEIDPRHKDLDELADGEHGEGMDWAMQLVNDAQFRLGLYYQRHGMDELARQSMEKYLHNRRHGVASIYDAAEAEEHLAAAAT